MAKFSGARQTFGLLVALYLSTTPSFADTQPARILTGLPKEQTTRMKVAANEKSKDMSREQMISHIRAANDVAKEWKDFGHHPFGAVLVAPDNQRILMHQGNISVVRHAET